MLESLLIGGPLVGGVLTLGVLGWNRAMRRRRKADFDAEVAKRTQLLPGSLELRVAWEIWKRAEGCGQIPILADGSYAADQLPAILRGFERAGAASHVGPILLLELDEDRRNMCLDNIPPIFRDRVIPVSSEHFSVGLSSATREEAEANSELWEEDVIGRARIWLSLIDASYKPGLLLFLLSAGGMAWLGKPAVKAFHDRYQHLPIYAVSILAADAGLRERTPEIRAFYSEDDLIRGYIWSDNRRDSSLTDLGLAYLFAGMVSAPWVSQQPIDLWNSLPHIFPKRAPGQVATASVWTEMLPMEHLDAWEDNLPEVYYANAAKFEEKAMRGIRAVIEDPTRQSLPLEVAGPGKRRVLCVIAPINPIDLQAIGTRINRRLESWLAKTDPQLSIQYASIGAPLDPQTKETRVVVVALQPLEGGRKRSTSWLRELLSPRNSWSAPHPA